MVDMKKVAERNASTTASLIGQLTLSLSHTEVELDGLKEENKSLRQQVADLTTELEALRNGTAKKEKTA